MNRTECALQMRKISVANPVIYGVFILAAGILVHHMMLNLLKLFTPLPYSPSIISGIFLCSAMCLFYACYFIRHLFGDGLWLIILFTLGFFSAEAEIMQHADTSLLIQKTR